MHPHPDMPVQVTLAHALKDFRDGPNEYLAGELYPIDGNEPEKVRRLHAARWIAWGGPAPAAAAKAAARREKMKEAELEAATAPAPSSPPPAAPAEPAPQATSRRDRARG